MFTFGIFTTHLPYIAFVVLYAGLWMFGDGHATLADRKDGDDVIFKVPACSFDTQNDQVCSFFPDDCFCCVQEETFACSYSCQSSKGLVANRTPLKYNSWRFTLFSRPPPFI